MTGSGQPGLKSGKMFKSIVRPAMLYGMETVTVTEKQVENMEVADLKMVRWALGVTRKDKKRVREGDDKDCKVGRQTLECEAPLVRTREKERRRLRGKKAAGDGGARQKEKRKAKEEVDGRDEGRYGEGWSCGRRRGGLGKVEETCALWRPRIGKSRKKKQAIVRS